MSRNRLNYTESVIFLSGIMIFIPSPSHLTDRNPSFSLSLCCAWPLSPTQLPHPCPQLSHPLSLPRLLCLSLSVLSLSTVCVCLIYVCVYMCITFSLQPLYLSLTLDVFLPLLRYITVSLGYLGPQGGWLLWLWVCGPWVIFVGVNKIVLEASPNSLPSSLTSLSLWVSSPLRPLSLNPCVSVCPVCVYIYIYMDVCSVYVYISLGYPCFLPPSTSHSL